MTLSYDGIRRRVFSVLCDALRTVGDDDRVKGALWTLSMSAFGKCSIDI